MEKITPLAKILHCRRQWRQWQISRLRTCVHFACQQLYFVEHGWGFCLCVISIVYQVILSKSRDKGWALLYQISNRVDCTLYAAIVWKSAEQGWARLKRGWFCLSAIREQQVRSWITLSSNLIIIIIIIFVTIMIITIVIDIVFVFHHSPLLFLHLLIGCLQTQNAKYS